MSDEKIPNGSSTQGKAKCEERSNFIQFSLSPDRFFYALPKDAPTGPCESSDFDKQLIELWNRAKRARIFKYDLNLLFKSLPGKYGLTVQLNCERAKHRRKPHHFKSISDPFDHRRFNFLKINDSEILMKLPDPPNEVASNKSPGLMQNEINAQNSVSTTGENGSSYIIINNSPISTGHCLIIPHRDTCAPQILTQRSVRLATEIMLASSCRYSHIIFNSILALASVNHLHLHLYYWPYSTKLTEWPTKPLCEHVHVVDRWMLPGFVVQLGGKDIDRFSNTVFTIVKRLTDLDVPHNVFMARASQLTDQGSTYPDDDRTAYYVTCYIFPRKPMYGSKPITTLAPASCELGGHVLVYSTWAFQELTEEKVMRILEEEAALPSGQFETYCDIIKSCFNSQ